MHDIPDEMLMAYADEALPPAERRRVEAALAADPLMGGRLAPFVMTRSALPEIFGEALTAPLPTRLIETIMQTPLPPTVSQVRNGARSEGMMSRLRGLIVPDLPDGPFFGNWGMIAAALVLVAGVGAVAGRFIEVGPRDSIAHGALASALETAPLGTEVTKDGLAAIAVSTFMSKDGSVCREYTMKGANLAREGFACRTGSGDWRIAFEGTPDGTPAAPADPRANRPAAAHEFKSLDAALEATMQGIALGKEQDEALRAKGWRVGDKN